MRLDKFLKVSRLIKRRTLAKELCDQGRVMVNERKAKAGTVLEVGDTISLRFGHKVLKIEVKQLVDSVKKESALDLYSILEEKQIPKEE